LFLCVLFLIPPGAFAQQQWSLGYWQPWGNPTVPLNEIEWGGLTHIVHAWALVRADGSLDLEDELVSTQGPILVSTAHAHGVKAILGLGQPYWRGETNNFQSAITSNLSGLVNNVMNVVNTYGFDGVDIDWEPFSDSGNGPAMRNLAAALRAALGTKTLSTSVIVNNHRYWGTVSSYFDRIGVMTYDLTGTWNPYSWHNSALYGPADESVWSIDLAVKRFMASGVPASKIAIGIPFFGYRWTGGGITGPRQNWVSTPSLQQIYFQSFYSSINSAAYRWDSSAAVPYLSIDNTGTSADQFLTFDDERSITEKVRYAQDRGLGGWIIWELSGGYVPNHNPSQPLLAAVRDAMNGGGGGGGSTPPPPPPPPADTAPPSVTIDQASSQADPVPSNPIYFTVVFSEPVSGFTSGDVSVTGTASGNPTATVSGSGTVYNVAIDGLSGNGTVIATIPAGVASDGAGNLNMASSSTDNSVTIEGSTTPDATTWSMGFWTPWGNPPIAPAAIDWGGLTHVVHAWALAQPDGTLDLNTNQVISQGPVLIDEAHAHGVKALLGIGQPFWLGQTTNLGLASTSNRAALVSNIMSIVNGYGFDGVHLDWKPFNPSTDNEGLRLLAADLRASLGDRILAGSAIVNDSATWATVQNSFDRIGLLTMHLTGTWNAYSWHNSALYGPDEQVWSAELAYQRFTAAGVTPSKLMIAIPFYGFQWTGGGITGPQQVWSTTPSLQEVNYQSFASSITSNNYRQDLLARVPYLTGSDSFLTFDDEWSVKEKTDYVKNKGLGGWMIWELSADYIPTRTPNQPLLAAIREAIGGDPGGDPEPAPEPEPVPQTDTAQPTVTVNQAPGQADPVFNAPIVFRVVFSEPVVGFEASDVTLWGGVTNPVVTVAGSGTTYDVTVSGLTSTVTVTAYIGPGMAADLAGNPNEGSTSTDATVKFRRRRWPLF
jgi:chitinase